MQRPYEDLARLLEAVASSTRLQILHQLRAPRLLSDIRVLPSLTRKGENPERPLARQTVTHHVEQLVRHGLLQRVPVPDGRGEGFVLHQASLFALFDEVRRLAKLRSVVGDLGAETVVAPRSEEFSLPATPRLLMAYGQEDGVAFPLHGDRPDWRVGRSPECEVRLDHDPWVSGTHARIERHGDRFTVTDLQSRNGTWSDWHRLAAGRARPLAAGSLLMVGRTLLVLQT